MDTQTLNTLIQVIGGILGAVLAALITTQKLPKLLVLFAAGIGLVVGIAVGFAVGPTVGCIFISQTPLEIMSPTAGSTVPQLITVQGTACGNTSQQIWLLVRPAGIDKYYPQPPGAISTFAGRWSADAGIGLPGDIGRQFTIIIALADSAAAATLRQYLDNIPIDGQVGLNLPPTLVRVDEVVVTRQ